MLAALTDNSPSLNLTHRVKDLPVPKFMNLLDQITGEFQHFLQAFEMINNDSLESLLEQILEAFTLKIGQVLNADRTTIFLVDEEKDELWAKVAQGDGDSRLKHEIRIPRDTGIAGHVATTGNYLNIPDAYAHRLFNRTVDRKTGYRTRNILCMPIFDASNTKVVAVVQLLNKVGNIPFDKADEHQFREFADAIGIILESCNSFYIAARNQRGVHSLLRATACLAQSLDLKDTLQVVMEEARKLMQADRSTLFLLDEETGELWSCIADANGTDMIDIRIPANRGIAGFVASTKQTLNIPNAYDDPRFDPTTDKRTGYRTENMLCMPVFSSTGDLIGVTQLINKHQGIFNRSDEEFMEAFNVQAGIALENAQLFERVLQEKQYQKDILASLSDAVISTDLDGNIMTINDAALALLGCPMEDEDGKYVRTGGKPTIQQFWREKLVGYPVWDCIPIDNLQFRLKDSLTIAARHYVPEQTMKVGVVHTSSNYTMPHGQGADNCLEDLWADPAPSVDRCANQDDAIPFSPETTQCHTLVLAIPDEEDPEQFWLWNDRSAQPLTSTAEGIQRIERNINLTVNPLTNPDGDVQGGLVVLEDISQEKRMKATMCRYMNPKVAERVMSLGDDALQVGERKNVSILFSDIRGYTSLTEKLEAPEVVALLNDYFGSMVEAVFNKEGTLDKFIGDALMAVFGAPLPLENHAWMAIQSALDMRERLTAFNANRNEATQIKIGIGISSGEVVSGNIGSQKRRDYTVIGDGVDISSRLEGLTKQYGTTDRHGCDIIFSEDTFLSLGTARQDQLYVRELDRIRVKGKQKPLTIYELIGDRSLSLSPQTCDFLDLYAEGRSAYNQMEFITALTYFRKAYALQPNDRAVLTHINRAKAYLKNPPDHTWDGVYTMTTK